MNQQQTWAVPNSVFLGLCATPTNLTEEYHLTGPIPCSPSIWTVDCGGCENHNITTHFLFPKTWALPSQPTHTFTHTPSQTCCTYTQPKKQL